MASPGYKVNPSASGTSTLSRQSEIMPSLFGLDYTTYPVQSKNYLYSFVAHVVGVAAILALAAYLNSHVQQVKEQFNSIALEISPYILNAGSQSGGGGGGGTHDKMNAPKGALPKTAREQFTPPVVEVKEQPKLAVAPTVVAPEIKMAPLTMGDPMAKLVVPPSNGIGGNAGIGDGMGTGVGTGRGPGVGPGWGGGAGGGAYRIGGGVSAPRAIYAPDPEYSEEARKAKYQGTVLLWIVVGPDGRVHDVKVQRTLGLGLDEKAMEAVKTWKFEPARKDGQAVAVQMNVEVSFRLY
jgi:TonB family protein